LTQNPLCNQRLIKRDITKRNINNVYEFEEEINGDDIDNENYTEIE